MGRYARGSARDAAAYSVVQALLRSKSVHLQPAREAPPLPHPFKPVLLITDHLNLIKQTSRYDGFATAVFIDLACPVGAASHLIYASLVRAPLKAQSALPVRPNPSIEVCPTQQCATAVIVMSRTPHGPIHGRDCVPGMRQRDRIGPHCAYGVRLNIMPLCSHLRSCKSCLQKPVTYRCHRFRQFEVYRSLSRKPEIDTLTGRSTIKTTRTDSCDMHVTGGVGAYAARL